MKLQRGKAYRLMPGATHVKLTKEGDLVAYRNPKKKTTAKKKSTRKTSKPRAKAKAKKKNPELLRGYQAIRHNEVSGAQLYAGIRKVSPSEARRIAACEPSAVWARRKRHKK